MARKVIGIYLGIIGYWSGIINQWLKIINKKKTIHTYEFVTIFFIYSLISQIFNFSSKYILNSLIKRTIQHPTYIYKMNDGTLVLLFWSAITIYTKYHWFYVFQTCFLFYFVLFFVFPINWMILFFVLYYFVFFTQKR